MSFNSPNIPIGQQPSAGSLSVVFASDMAPLAITGTITSTDLANGVPGSPTPVQAVAIGGRDGSGNLQLLKVSSTGVLSVDGSAVTQPVSGTFWQATQPISGTVTA